MNSEETPLLAPENAQDRIFNHETIYDRFNVREKAMILAMVSFCGLIPLFVSGSFVPLVPQIAKDLESTGPIVSLAISLSIFAAGLGSLSGGSYSTFYGRRPVYLCGLCLLCIGSIGVALASSITVLMFWRFFQTFGAAPAMSVGAGVIGDIYRLEQRGTAMGIFLASILLGPTLAPLAGGLAAHYASWRFMQFALGIAALVAFLCMFAFFPETCHPNSRGIDKTRRNLDGTICSNFVFINPFASLWLLRSPVLMAVSVSTFLILLTDFSILIPMAYTIGVRYNIHNEALLGACFLPNGLGDIVGAPLAGWISDRMVVRWRDRRGGLWYPEDRLRGTLIAASTFAPLSVLFFGLSTQFLGGKVGLILDLVCLFMNGVGVQMVLGPGSAYVVDIMHARSAESVAAVTGFRSWMISATLTGALPLINGIGVAPAYAVSAVLAWVGFGLLWCIIRYGGRMRAWNDIGFSTAASN